jgi:hypothetical protein
MNAMYHNNIWYENIYISSCTLCLWEHLYPHSPPFNDRMIFILVHVIHGFGTNNNDFTTSIAHWSWYVSSCFVLLFIFRRSTMRIICTYVVLFAVAYASAEKRFLNSKEIKNKFIFIRCIRIFVMFHSMYYNDVFFTIRAFFFSSLLLHYF